MDQEDAAEWSEEDRNEYYDLKARLRDLEDEQSSLQARLMELAQSYGIPRLDGVKCRQTIELTERHNCSGFALSKWWVLTPPDWGCPTCKRTKPEIARKDRNGALMGQLVEHHDHLVDLLRALFFKTYCQEGNSAADELAQKFVNRVKSAFTRFEAIIICVDCNTADANAKKMVGAARQFSFTPDELSSFIVARPNAPVTIKQRELHQVYRNALPSFSECVRVATEFAKLAAGNLHWFQEVSRQSTPVGIRNMADGSATLFGLSRHSYEYALLPETRRRGQHGWITKAPRSAKRPPTEEEVRFVANVQSKRDWNRVPENWSCPVCLRSKLQIVRPTTQFPWNFGVSDTKLKDESLLVCGDCNQTTRQLNREAREAGLLDYSGKIRLSVEELRRLIRPQPHGMHHVNGKAVDDLLAAIEAEPNQWCV